MKYELIKELKRKLSNGKVYKVLPIGRMVDVDEIKAHELMAAGYIADPNKPKAKAKAIEPKNESKDKTNKTD